LKKGSEANGETVTPPPDAAEVDAFLLLFSRDQGRIAAFIRALVPPPADADDLFQKTSLVLWRSFASFDSSQPFLPWALGVARHQVLMHWRARRRDRHVFSDDVLAALADEAGRRVEAESPSLLDRQRALDACVDELAPRQRELIRRFYGLNEQAKAIAASWDRSVHAVYKSLRLMRKALEACVERRLALLGEDIHLTDGRAPESSSSA